GRVERSAALGRRCWWLVRSAFGWLGGGRRAGGRGGRGTRGGKEREGQESKEGQEAFFCQEAPCSEAEGSQEGQEGCEEPQGEAHSSDPEDSRLTAQRACSHAPPTSPAGRSSAGRQSGR